MLSNNKSYLNDNLRDVQKVFNDGVVYVYKATERTITDEKGKFFFCNETLGEKQYNNAYINGVEIDRVISIPFNKCVNKNDLVKINNDMFRVIRMTYKDNKKPFHWRLTLKKDMINYEIKY